MNDLTWSWLAAPYVACCIALVVLAGITLMVRGDRVLRLGVIGASATTLPWAICSGIVACTHDPELATRLLRLGSGPVAMIGPCLLFVLLGATGQLERHRWIARIAGVIGAVMMGLCWGTPWTVPGVHLLSSGMYYVNGGPLTPFHVSQLGLWLAVGLYIARSTSTRQERRQATRLLLAILVAGAVGAGDLLLVYDIWGAYPMAWLPTLIACGVALYLVTRGDLLRSQGFDSDTAIELGAFAVAGLVVAFLVVALDGATPIALAGAGALAWVVSMAVAWSVTGRRRVAVRVTSGAEELAMAIADRDDPVAIEKALAESWERFEISNVRMWLVDGAALRRVGSADTWELEAELLEWLVVYGESIAVGDLATMRLGPIRPQVEDMVSAHDATLIVPLLDRGSLVGLCEATHERALRDHERVVVIESARAVGRQLAFARLSAIAAKEGESAREVEVAEAMRLQAAISSASDDDDLGRWALAAEYRSSPRTTSATWSTALLADGRLALLVTEAQAHGVPAALATAALTGAFVAATGMGSGALDLDQLLAALRASSEGVVRGGEPVAAFVALLDDKSIQWACAGHPGAVLCSGDFVIPAELAMGSGDRQRPRFTPLGGGGQRAGASLATATRGTTPIPAGAFIVIGSSELRGDDEGRWQMRLFEVAGTGGRMAAMLVERAFSLAAEKPVEDLLAVVVRARRRGA